MEEAESLIRGVIAELSNPANAGTTCTPSVLLERTKTCLDVIDKATANFSLYNNDASGIPDNARPGVHYYVVTLWLCTCSSSEQGSVQPPISVSLSGGGDVAGCGHLTLGFC